MTVGYRPDEDPVKKLRHERVGALRVFLYVGPLFVPPTVLRELEDMPDVAKRKYHHEISGVLLLELAGQNSLQVRDRANVLGLHHPDENDCLVLAEVEAAGLTHLLTLDHKLRSNLGAETYVEIVTAAGFWNDLGLSRPADLKIEPRPDNPLALDDWWRW